MAKSLRLGKLGLLKYLDIFPEHGLKPLLPLKTTDPDDGCIRPNPDLFCFQAGNTDKLFEPRGFPYSPRKSSAITVKRVGLQVTTG